MGFQAWVQPLVAICDTDGPALTAAAAASCLPAKARFAVQNGYWQQNKMWKIHATGRISSVITTPGTARFDIRMGSTVVFDSLAILLDTVAAHVTVGWVLDIDLGCRTTGAGTAATLFGQGTWTCEDILGVAATAPKAVGSAMLPWNAAPAVGGGFDSTVANAFDMFFTQTVATGSMTLHTIEVWEVN